MNARHTDHDWRNQVIDAAGRCTADQSEPREAQAAPLMQRAITLAGVGAFVAVMATIVTMLSLYAAGRL